jgi:hypothetical protein
MLSAGEKNKEESIGAICATNPEDGQLVCHLYRREKFLLATEEHEATGSSRKDAILETLQKCNVTCYIVEENTTDLLKDIREIIDKVSRENRNIAFFDPKFKMRCCLLEDKDGRLFNLVVSEHTVGSVSEWVSTLSSFSGSIDDSL